MPDSPHLFSSPARRRAGGATARALLKSGVPVWPWSATPRPSGPRHSRHSAPKLVVGDLDDRDSVVRRCRARAVFSVQMPDFDRRGFEGRSPRPST